MASRRSDAIALLTVFVLSSAQASSFLFLFPMSTFSHHLYLSYFWENLTSRGHQVTLITSTTKFQMESISVIYLQVPYDITTEFNTMVYGQYNRQPLSSWLQLEKQFGLRGCKMFCESKDLHDLVNNCTKYDVVFVAAIMEDCAFPIATLFSDKIVYVNFPRHFSPVYTFNFGITAPYSFFPYVMSYSTSTMSFSQRFWNALACVYHVFVLRDYTEQEKIVKSNFPTAPDIQTSLDKVSLIFTNSDNVFSESVPSASNVIKIGGLQCRDAKPLQEYYQKILSGKSGVILFSLGTVVRMSYAGNETVQAFIDAFAMLKETVIWKTNIRYTNLPANIKTFPTIPQQDILGNSNIRLFITQGGIFSLLEALYHAVPVLGIPVMIDQYSNMKRVEELGIGKQLDVFSNLTKDNIYFAIRNIIDDSRYKQNAIFYSTIFKDVDMSPLNRAVFWTEWLTRHSDVQIRVIRQSFLKMNTVKYFTLDVVFFLLCIVIIPIIVLKTCYSNW